MSAEVKNACRQECIRTGIECGSKIFEGASTTACNQWNFRDCTNCRNHSNVIAGTSAICIHGVNENFITDNCTTRVKDGLFNHSHYVPQQGQVSSFTEKVVLAPYQKGIPWIGLGIDLLLGSFSDQKPTDHQSAFLPELLFNQLAGIKKLVSFTQISNFNVATNKTESNSKDNTPLYILFTFLVLYALSIIFKSKAVQTIACITDIVLLIAFTLGGTLIFYMSFMSNHTACYRNFNIMWMHPLYFIAVIAYFLKDAWISHIGKIFLAAIFGLVITSYWLPQHFSIEVFTLMAIAVILNYRLIQRGQLITKE